MLDISPPLIKLLKEDEYLYTDYQAAIQHTKFDDMKSEKMRDFERRILITRLKIRNYLSGSLTSYINCDKTLAEYVEKYHNPHINDVITNWENFNGISWTFDNGYNVFISAKDKFRITNCYDICILDKNSRPDTTSMRSIFNITNGSYKCNSEQELCAVLYIIENLSDIS